MMMFDFLSLVYCCKLHADTKRGVEIGVEHVLPTKGCLEWYPLHRFGELAQWEALQLRELLCSLPWSSLQWARTSLACSTFAPH